METIRVKSKIVEHQNTFISRKTIKPPKFIDAYIYIAYDKKEYLLKMYYHLQVFILETISFQN